MAKTETTDIWRQQGGYLVFVDKDGFVRRCIRQNDREAKVLTLRVLMCLYTFRNVALSGKDKDVSFDVLMMYETSGADEGIYVEDEKRMRRLARQYNIKFTQRECDEIKTYIEDDVERVKVCTKRNLVPVNNGIFDYDTKQLMPFSSEYVFTSKCRVDYVPNPINPVIHNPKDGTDWDVESWMHTLSDDDDVVDLLWEITGAIIRPNVSWNKMALLYSEAGNNGKGTLCELMRELCGEGTYASVKLSDMGKDFALEPLIRTSAIIVDENDVGTFIDKVANLKALITHDVVPINRKFKQGIAYRWCGFMVQCINEMPRCKW